MWRCGNASGGIGFICAALMAGPAVGQMPTPPMGGDALSKTMERLGIALPRSVAETPAVRAALEELGREICDRTAIANLGAALRKSSYRREGAVALMAFSKQCSGDTPSLRAAVNILMDLSDYKAAARAATELIAMEPLRDNGYFLRAVAHERGGEFKSAVDDYTTAIELFANKSVISSVGYEGLARAQEKLGQMCDAALTIESWIAINPRNDTARARSMIATYAGTGKCTSGDKMDDTFPLQRRGDVVIIDVTINGVKGKFVFDTGASSVTLRRTFAEKAKVEIDEASTVKLSTANGIAEGKRGRAKLIQLKSVKSSDVPIIVQNEAKGSYGDGIEGLLGMSFLSRFNVTVGKDTIRVTSRGAK
jgi:clan AA aspartic protease (TIGR02281 family)